MLFDLEHSGFGFETVKSALRYFEAADLPAIVRVPSREYHHIARAMDMGAEGLMLPMVGNADEVRHIVNSMKYHPAGKRGVALQVAHDRYRPGAVADKFAAANERTTLFCQIETAEGVENADAMAAIDGVDCLWVGHFDLSVSLGIPGRVRASKTSPTRSTTRRRGHEQAQQGARPAGADGRAGHRDLRAGLRLHLLFRRCLGAAQRARRGDRQAARRLQAEGEATMAERKFRVALSGDFRKADGSPTYPDFDLDAAAQRAGRRDGVPRIGEPDPRPSSSRISTR